jgi:hypothetical protein
MVRVRWSEEAEADLAAIKPAVREQLRNNAEEILHLISPGRADPADEGVDGEVMWHRADGHGRFAGEPEEYFLLYAKCDPPSFENPEENLELEILAVRSIYQLASMYLRMGGAQRQSH